MYKQILKIRLVYLFFWLLISISCQKDENSSSNDDVLGVDVHQTTITGTSEMKFNHLSEVHPVFSTNELLPSEYAYKVNRLEGIPDLDTFLIMTESFKYGTFIREIVLEEKFKRSREFFLDSIKMFDDSTLDKLNVFSGVKGNNQIIIVDANNNQNFKDDTVFRFDRNKIQNINIATLLDTLPISTVEYRSIRHGEKIKKHRRIQVFPDPNHLYTYYLDNSISKQLAVFFKLKDFWKGILTEGKEKYEIGLQGLSNKFMAITIKNEKLEFMPNDEFNKSFYYRVTDTVKLGENLYTIDSINNEISRIFFSKLKVPINYRSYRVGYQMEDFELRKLDNSLSKLKKLTTGKKYILLDFWGTWCQPCIELTPELKSLNSNRGEDLDLVSIAYDESIQKVKEFTQKHGMTWSQVFVTRGNRKGIIRDLQITEYPTFILLNDELEILYRGSGKEAIQDIKNML